MMLRRPCSPSTSWSSMARTFASGCSSSAITGSVGYCLVVAMACNSWSISRRWCGDLPRGVPHGA
jgi:hypothetical protein